MRTVPLALGLLALLGCSTGGWQTHRGEYLGYRYKAGCVDVSAELAAALAEPCASATITADEVRVVVPESDRVYFFTQESHPAHPGMVVVGPEEAGVVPLDAFAGGDLPAFEEWLRRIAAQRAETMATTAE